MFCIGDKIVYPMYGAGIIEGLEEKEVSGTNQFYYILRIPVGNLKIMVSVGKAENLGLREVHDKERVLEVIKSILDKPIDMPDNWNQRYKENMDKIKSGNLSEVSLVYRNLLLREKEKGLSNAEKKLLTTAKQIIISELILSKNIEKNIAEEVLLNTVELYEYV